MNRLGRLRCVPLQAHGCRHECLLPKRLATDQSYMLSSHPLITSRALARALRTISGTCLIRSGPACTNCTAKLKIWTTFTTTLKPAPIFRLYRNSCYYATSSVVGRKIRLNAWRALCSRWISREHYPRAGQHDVQEPYNASADCTASLDP